MTDERKDSIRQGINAPEESPIGRRAEEERRQNAADAPRMDAAMGGTSDGDSPADEAAANAAMRERESEDEAGESEEAGPAYWNLPSRLRGKVLPPE